MSRCVISSSAKVKSPGLPRSEARSAGGTASSGGCRNDPRLHRKETLALRASLRAWHPELALVASLFWFFHLAAAMTARTITRRSRQSVPSVQQTNVRS